MNRRESKAIRQEQIISAISKLVANKGLHSLTTAALAQEVGITEGALFKHFSSKEDMLRAAVRKAWCSLVDRMREIANGDLPPEEKIRALLYHHIGLWEANAETCRFLFRIIFSDEVYTGYPTVKETAREILGKYVSCVEGILQQGIDQGVFKPVLSVSRLSHILVGLLQGALMRWYIYEGKLSLKEEAEQIYKVIMLLSGKGAPDRQQ